MSSPPGDIRLAARDSLPVVCGYLPLGMVFGFLFTQAGGDWWWATLCSVLVYSGAAQYAMVPLLAAGASVPVIAFTVLVINLRHVFYGLSLLDRAPARGWRRLYYMFALTDETYSVLSSLPAEASEGRMMWLSFFDHCGWIGGSTLGALIGTGVSSELRGIDFVLTALFAMLTLEQWRGRRRTAPLWAALLAFVLTRFVWPDYALVLGIAGCAAVGLILGARRRGEGHE